MKVIYNSKEIINSTNNYNILLNRPMINSKVLQGAVTLSDVNAYTKDQIDELIGNTRAIEIMAALPINVIENTLYYIGPRTGPQGEDIYDVYLVDSVRNVRLIGTSQFGEYFAGEGTIIDDDNYISAKVDNKTIIVDSENNLHAVLDMDSVPVMVGATSSAAGEKGLVPQPSIGTQRKSLVGSAAWFTFMDVVYPIGSVYLTYDNSRTPNEMFPGTNWVKLSDGALWTGNSSGTTLTPQLPALKGAFTVGPNRTTESTAQLGAFRMTAGENYRLGMKAGSPYYYYADFGNAVYYFYASKGTYKMDGTQMTTDESPYGKTSVVDVKTIAIVAWQRTA